MTADNAAAKGLQLALENPLSEYCKMIIEVTVKSRSREEKIEKVVSASSSTSRSEIGNTDSYILRTHKPAVKGQANQAVIKLIAEYFNVAKSAVSIKSGFRVKKKLVEISAEVGDVGEADRKKPQSTQSICNR